MGIKTPPCKKWPLWTEARYRTFIRSAIRAATMKWPPAQHAWKLAQRPSQLDDKRVKFEYQCKDCGGWFKRKDCENNHIVPSGVMMTGMDHSTIGDYVDRSFSSIDGYEILCKPCHLLKTTQQRENGWT